MKKFSLLFIISLILFSCEKHEITVSGLKGTWVEVDTKTDTIIFNGDNTSGLFILLKGYEIRNGYVLPKMGSGIFMYELHKDSIAITDGFSSIIEKELLFQIERIIKDIQYSNIYNWFYN
jgi:hypothetical protein